MYSDFRVNVEDAAQNGHTDGKAYVRELINNLHNGIAVVYSSERAGIYAPVLDLAFDGQDSSNIDELLSAIKAVKERHPPFEKLLDEVEKPDGKPTMPPLPEYAQLATGTMQQVSPFLTNYIEYSRLVSPEGYEDFHLACGLWVLSTVAARRIQVPLSDPVITPLSIIMVGRTSLFAKTTTAKAGIRLLKAAHLNFLLGADETTPQKLLHKMAGHVPANYEQLGDRQDLARQRLAFCGQLGWYYDEFNQLINAMTRQGGPMAEFAGLLRKLDNCPDEYSYETKSGGDDYIKNPYLALLGSTTTANIAKHAARGAEFWNDGFWARMLFTCPPPNEFITKTMTDGIVEPDQSLVDMLTHWNDRLGVPVCSVTEIIDEDNKHTGKYEAESDPLPMTTLTLGRGVLAAFTSYRLALRTLIAESTTGQDLDGSYARLPTMSMRIAALLASLENNGTVTVEIWTLAQEITEIFRENLHRLYTQVSVATEDNPYEEMLIDYLKEIKKDVTVRDILRAGPPSIRKLKSEGVRSLLVNLERCGIVLGKKEGRKEWYSLTAS